MGKTSLFIITLPTGMAFLVEGLLHNRTVTSLNLGENLMDRTQIEMLIKLLTYNPWISQLYLDWGATNKEVGEYDTPLFCFLGQ